MNMAKLLICVVVAVSLCVCNAKIYFKEEFDDGEDWKERWVQSDWKDKSGMSGKFELALLKDDFVDEERDIGLKTMEDVKFYTISVKFPTFSNKGKTLVVQYQMTYEKKIECSGGYIKLAPKIDDLSKVTDKAPYNIMFGPDICGRQKKTHLIFHHKGVNMDSQKKLTTLEHVTQPHLYTLILKPDNTFQVLIDGEKVESGTLLDNWPFLPPKEIDDPSDKKPKDWDDEEFISDPEVEKPEEWDDTEFLPAEENTAEQPDDWDEEEDGEWVAPPLKNPNYMGKWSAPKIANPNYQGKWEPRKIENPDYNKKTDTSALYAYDDFSTLILDLWQLNAGTHFDNFIITDDFEEAKKLADETFKPLLANFKINEEIRQQEAEAARLREVEKEQDDEIAKDEL